MEGRELREFKGYFWMGAGCKDKPITTRGVGFNV